MDTDELEYYSVPPTVCNECGEESTYGAYEGDFFFCNDCWDKYEVQKQEKKKQKKRQKKEQKLLEEKRQRHAAQREYMEADLKKDADQRARVEKLRLFLSDLDNVRDFYSNYITESKGIPPEIPLVAIHFNPDDVVPILLEIVYDPKTIHMYGSEHLLEWYILLHINGEARSELGKKIMTTYITRPGTEIHPTHPLSWEIKNRVPKNVQRGDRLRNAGHVIMLMNDSQHFMQTVAENLWIPALSQKFYLHLYREEHVKHFINPNFDVCPAVHNPAHETSYNEHWYNTDFGRRYLKSGKTMP